MKIGITGASGFLGNRIASGANDRGWEVVGFSRRAHAAISGCEEVRQFNDVETIDLSELDALIHLAGEPIFGFWNKEKQEKIRTSRVGLTSDIVDAMEAIPRARRPKTFVSASAVGYYGDCGDEWLDEESDVGFGFLAEVCRDWEKAAMDARRLGVRVVCPRIGILIGKGGLVQKARKIFRMRLGGKFGKGDQWMSWIHVDDAAEVFLKCVETNEIRGAVNCVAPRPVTNTQFTDTFAQLLERRASLPVPEFVLKRLPNRMKEMFLFSQKVDPVVLKAFDFRWEHVRIDDAIRDALESRDQQRMRVKEKPEEDTTPASL